MVVHGVGFVIDRNLGEREVARRLAWLSHRVLEGSRQKVYRKD